MIHVTPPRSAPVGPALTSRAPAVVIGIGNEFRRDDGTRHGASSHGLGLDDAIALATAARAVLGDLDGQP